jgi:hypothetical protein
VRTLSSHALSLARPGTTPGAKLGYLPNQRDVPDGYLSVTLAAGERIIKMTTVGTYWDYV